MEMKSVHHTDQVRSIATHLKPISRSYFHNLHMSRIMNTTDR